MPTFDIVNKLDTEAFKNAVDAVNREITTRYDFKGSESEIVSKEKDYYILADSDLKLNQIKEILGKNLVRKTVDVKSIVFEKEEKASGNKIKQTITVQEGIDKEIAQVIIKQIKNKKLKVQPSIQGDQIRISGKKRDELQEAIGFLKTLELPIPINFTNFRD
ncbi:YajQ family cyclic di-GMP-binding protein [Alphaproteobacteria bacterium]|nr:YajQ family cyclic di-GMP-binding protein [Alphaproteobacteria bacterium]